MKILVISNMYPPYYIGGFELVTQDVVKGLQDFGHQVIVLSSTYGLTHRENSPSILRWLDDPLLKSKPDLFSLLSRERSLKSTLGKAIELVAPDVILVMGITGIPASIYYWLGKSKVEVIFTVFDENLLNFRELDTWYRFWNQYSPNKRKAYLKKIASIISTFAGYPTEFQPVFHGIWFGSHYLKSVHEAKGIHSDHSIVLYPPIPENLLRISPIPRDQGEPLFLLFAGRLCKEKGLHTVIRAMGILKAAGFEMMPRLSVAAKLNGSDYEKQIQSMISEAGLNHYVSFLGLIPREKMAEVYSQHHAVVFATEIQEPFGMIPLEAMASGIAVISTATGGTREYLQDEINCLIYQTGDENDLAKKIMLLTKDEYYRKELCVNGRSFSVPFTSSKDRMQKLHNFLMSVDQL